jgi:hypothetical protein
MNVFQTTDWESMAKEVNERKVGNKIQNGTVTGTWGEWSIRWTIKRPHDKVRKTLQHFVFYLANVRTNRLYNTLFFSRMVQTTDKVQESNNDNTSSKKIKVCFETFNASERVPTRSWETGRPVVTETRVTRLVFVDRTKKCSGHCIRLRNKKTLVRIPPGYKVFRET